VVRHHAPAAEDLGDLRLRLPGQRGDLPLRDAVLLQQPEHRRYVTRGQRPPHVRPLPHCRIDRLSPSATSPAGGTVTAVERIRLDTHGSATSLPDQGPGSGCATTRPGRLWARSRHPRDGETLHRQIDKLSENAVYIRRRMLPRRWFLESWH